MRPVEDGSVCHFFWTEFFSFALFCWKTLFKDLVQNRELFTLIFYPKVISFIYCFIWSSFRINFK